MKKQQPILDTDTMQIVDEPPVWKWILGIGIGFLVIGLFYAANLFGSSYYFIKLHAKLVGDVSNNQSIKNVLNNKAYEPLLKNQDKSIDAIIGVQGYLETKEYARAVSWSSNAALKKLRGQSDFSASIKALEAAAGETKKSLSIYQQVRINKQALESQYAFLTSRFARTVGLEQLADDWQEKAAQISKNPDFKIKINFYSKGALSGLPTLEGVPDDLKSHQDLSEFLPKEFATANRRKLRLPRSEIRREITSLEADSAELAVSWEKLNGELPKVKVESDLAQAKLDEARNKVRIAQKELIEELSRPEISPQALAIYSFIRKQTKLNSLPEFSQI